MEKLGIYTIKTTSASTSAFVIELDISGTGVGIGTIGDLIVAGVNTSFNSYVKHHNFTGVGTADGSAFSHSSCVVYEASNISGTTVSIDFIKNTVDSPYAIEVTITPGSSTSTTWSVYYRDESFETI
jgi:hypothetical protein